MPKFVPALCPTCQRPTRADESCSFCLFQLGKSEHSRQAMDDLPSPEELARSFPQLEITRLVGRGGMGAIYHARQRSLDRDVALKIIARNVASDPAFEERFKREAQTLARLSHPNIVTVYDFGATQDGLVYLLMEFVDGVNLREAMDAGSIRPREAIQIISEMCAALQFAHDRGVVHRDIKPENVLVNEDGLVKVADFGLAKLLGDSPTNLTLTQTRQVMGTLRYMSPEQMENPGAVDHRADIYSLGVVFYELLTGQVPHGRFDSPSHVNQAVSPLLDEIVMRTLDRQPPKRYQRASEIASRLSELNDEPQGSPSPAEQPSMHSPNYSVPFEAEALGSFAVAVGSIKLNDDTLDISYRTRDSILGIVKSAAKSVRIPLSELSNLEWLPGVFGSKLAIVPKSHRFAEELPNADDGRSLLKIRFSESQSAARLVYEASRRAPALRGRNSSNSFIQNVAASGMSHTVTRVRATLGILFLGCVLLNIIALVLLLVFLSPHTDQTPTILAIIFAPIFTLVTVGVQLVGGIYCFSPYTRRMPLAAATVSMIPLTLTWPIGFCVGLWTWIVLGPTTDSRNSQQPFLSLERSRTSRIGTTLLFLRESRWSRVVAIANMAGAVVLASLFVGYRFGYYPTTLTYRVVGDDIAWSGKLQDQAQAPGPHASKAQQAITSRLKNVSGFLGLDFEQGQFSQDKRAEVRAMKWAEPQIRQALAVSGSVRWAWVVPPLGQPEAIPAWNAKLGGAIKKQAFAPGMQVALAAEPQAIHIEDLKSLAGSQQELILTWTSASRAAIEESKPSQAIGLALIVEELVEGFAALDEVTIRATTFSMAEGSRFEPAAIEAAIRGPALLQPLELLNRN